MATTDLRPRDRFLAAYALLIVLAAGMAPAVAQDTKPAWVEPRYNPPIGSRWSVVTQYHRDETTDGKPAMLAYTIRSELTIDGKTGANYRITYLNRDMTADGTAANVPMLRAVSAVLKGITVRATLDESGKPQMIDNLADVQVSMRKAIETAVAASSDKPAGVDLFRQMLTRILMVDAQQGAATYLDALPSLALGQNTGLTPGQERRRITTSPNPMGGEPIRSILTLKLIAADPVTGKARFLKNESYDPDSVSHMISDGVRRLLAAEGKDTGALDARVKSLMQSVKVERSERTEIDVEDGMTRNIRSNMDVTSSGLGVTFIKRETKTVTVTPLP